MEGNLTLSARPLAEFAGLFGVSDTDLADVERAERLAHTFPVPGARAARLRPEDARRLVSHYGSAVRVEFRTGDLIELVVDENVTDRDVKLFASAATSGSDYDMVVRVDKPQLVRQLAGPPGDTQVVLFLFAEAACTALARGLAAFEADVWADPRRRLALLVLDSPLEFDGDYLTVLGGPALAHAGEAVGRPAPDPQRLSVVLDARDWHIDWQTRWTRALTPWHFAVAGTGGHPRLVALLRSQLVKLTVLYTCDRARSRERPGAPPEIRAEYRGSEHVAVLPIDEHEPLPEITDRDLAAVLRVFDWCYQREGRLGQPDWVSDRLPFVQTRVAQALESRPEPTRFHAFATAMPYLIEGIEWHWKAFIEGKVSDYLDRVQQLETLVGDTVDRFGQQASELVKNLTDTMLAAVAVLIGSFIAAAFDTPFNDVLFRIGVLTYAAYVALFPGAVGLLASSRQLARVRAEFNARRARYNEVLYPDKVDEIVGSRIHDAVRSYWQWFIFVILCYLGVVAAAVAAAMVVPHHLR
jgi:hypothetical protein